MKDLTKGKPWKTILFFAIPIFMGNLFNIAYGLADTRILGHYVGNDALEAVGSISTLNDLFLGFIMGLANGYGVIIAQHFGAGKKDKARKLFALTLELGFYVTALIVVVSLGMMPVIFKGLNVAAKDYALSMQYIRIVTIGLFFSLMYSSMAACLRAIGDAYTPLIFLIISAVTNVILDIVFVKSFGLGVGGAAFATVVSQGFSAILCMIYTWIKYPFLRIKLADFKLESNYVKPMLSSGISMGLMSCLVQFGTLSLQSAINGIGDYTIVAHAATRKLTSIYMLPFGVLGTSMATYCGQNYGANRYDRIKEGIKSALFFSYCWCILTIIASYTICPMIIRLMTATKVDEVVETATRYQQVDTLFYFFVPTIAILRNSLQGMGDRVTPIFSSSMELVGKIIFAFIFTPIWGYWAIIYAEPVSWMVMVIPLIRSMIKRLKINNA